VTLAGAVDVSGPFEPVALPPAATTATAGDGYGVRLHAGTPAVGKQAKLSFDVTRAGQPVALAPYLGARGHLVALRSSDLAYLHVHPTAEPGAPVGRVSFETQFATAGRYRLFVQFKHDGRVHTAAFTVRVAR